VASDRYEGTTTIDGNESPLVVIDEVGAWLKRISSKGQSGNVSEIPAKLQELWGWPPKLEWIGSKTKGKEIKTVLGPAFSLYGISTERKLITALTADQVENGFVNRFLLFNIGRGALRPVKPLYDWLNMPGWLGVALQDGVAGAKIVKPGLADGRRPVKVMRRLGWDDGVEQLWEDWWVAIRGMPDPDEYNLWARAPEQTLRLATVEAYWRGAEVIDATGWEWAKAVVTQSMRQLAGALRKNMREDLAANELADTIRAEFQKEANKKWVPGPLGDRRVGVLTHGAIHKLCGRKVGDLRKIDQAIAHLLKSEEIVDLPWSGPGRPTQRWEWQG
jgi:hypothetical protein